MTTGFKLIQQPLNRNSVLLLSANVNIHGWYIIYFVREVWYQFTSTDILRKKKRKKPSKYYWHLLRWNEQPGVKQKENSAPVSYDHTFEYDDKGQTVR